MKVEIRKYRESDRPTLVKLLEELLDYVASVDDLKRIRRMPGFGESYARRILHRVPRNNGMIYVAESDSEVVGVVVGTILAQSGEDMLEHVPSKFGEVLELVVSEGYRDKGIGTRLMNELEGYFEEKNCNIAGVGVLAPNDDAHRLYNKLGYVDRSFYMTKDLVRTRVPTMDD
jgi:ribosomal protein S18 acetylase RimI-like enzyme